MGQSDIVEVHDVIITEIMADPSPGVRLPEKEYLEVYNRSDRPLNLRDWVISDKKRTAALPERLLLPKEYLLLCATTNAMELADSVNVLAVSPWPALNNSGDLITLRDPEGQVVHFVDYQQSWYRSELKEHGGWALEMIDTNYPCSSAANWTASVDLNGGTPGSSNSVTADNPDLRPPQIISTLATSPLVAEIIFDQTLNPINYKSTRFIITPKLSVDTFFLSEPSEPVMIVKLKDSLQRNTIYKVRFEGIADCNGNVLRPQDPGALLGLANDPQPLDMIINEILFNPRPLGKRFVELYNRSPRAFNLKDWKFARWQGDAPVDITALATENHMVYPGAYRVFTENVAVIKNQYPQSAEVPMIQVTDLPTLGDREGSIVLLSKHGGVIDSFSYHQNFHHPLLIDQNGVSLERIDFEGDTNSAGNWSSASEASGYGTPGKPNSQRSEPENHGSLLVEPRIFAPFSGSSADYTRISYNMASTGNIGTAIIFDANGRLVKSLMNNSILDRKGIFQWDGTDNSLHKVPVGYYLIYFQAVNPSGGVRVLKRTVVVAPGQ